MYNPYQNVNWNTVSYITSATHMHVTDQKSFDIGYQYGMRYFSISNYYPSAPYHQNTRMSDFYLNQNWPVTKNGETISPPINWNNLLNKSNTTDPLRSELPFTETEPLFKGLPKDILIGPNAEHHDFTNSPIHICSPGSMYCSGNISRHTHPYGFPYGVNKTWQEGFGEILENMAYKDAGGIVICHPTWCSQLSDEHVFELLDFDDRVLGIEIYNDYSAIKNWYEKVPNYQAPPETQQGFSTNMWDRILSTGRKCFGFCVPDHSLQTDGNFVGRCVLLVPEFSDHDCLAAYKNGCFYGCLKGNGLAVTEVNLNESTLKVKTNMDATFKFISESGMIYTTKGYEANYQIPNHCIFLRVEIEDNSGERLFLQPIMFSHDPQ